MMHLTDRARSESTKMANSPLFSTYDRFELGE